MCFCRNRVGTVANTVETVETVANGLEYRNHSTRFLRFLQYLRQFLHGSYTVSTKTQTNHTPAPFLELRV
jgi:hypothetical protein